MFIAVEASIYLSQCKRYQVTVNKDRSAVVNVLNGQGRTMQRANADGLFMALDACGQHQERT